jgi:hypothetical protein
MKTKEQCHERSLVDAHFRGRISPAQEQAMREHMLHCEDCREHYKRMLLLANLDPKCLDSRARLARGLGVANRPYMLKPMALVAAASVVMIFLVIWYGNTGPTDNDGFAARGEDGHGEAARLWIYRVPPGKPSVLANNEVDANDELAFAYENSEGKKYLLVFGIDEHHNVYWYHPEWRVSTDDPQAISVSREQGVHELPEAIRHTLKGDKLKIFGIFTDRPLTVRQVEDVVREAGGLLGASVIKDAVQVVQELKVRH